MSASISKLSASLQHHCAWAQAVRFVNRDGSAFDYSSGDLTGQIRRSAGQSSDYAGITITRSSPTIGEAVLSMSAESVGLLSLTSTSSFGTTTALFGEIDFVPQADPNNPIRLAEIDVRVSPGGNAQVGPAAAPTIPLETVNLVVGAASPATTRALLGLSPQQIAYQVLMS